MASDSVDNLTQAVDELTQARSYQEKGTSWFTVLFVCLTAMLWTWEYIHTQTVYFAK